MATIGNSILYVKIPKLNPMKWLKAEFGVEDYFTNSIIDFEHPAEYLNPFQIGDPLNAQMAFNMNFVSKYAIQLIDCNDNVKATASAVTMWTDSSNYRYVHFNLVSTGLSEGIRYMLLTVTLTTGQIQHYITEPIDLKTTQENTVYLDYSNSVNDFGMIFQSPNISALSRVRPSTVKKKPIYRLRVKGGYWSGGFQPASDDIVYTNQSWDFQTVSSIPYVVRTLTIGDAIGVPNYIYDIVNRIFACNYVEVNDVQVNKIEGAKLEVARMDRTALCSMTIDIAKADNEYSDEYSFSLVRTGIGFEIIGFNLVVH